MEGISIASMFGGGGPSGGPGVGSSGKGPRSIMQKPDRGPSWDKRKKAKTKKKGGRK